MLRRTATTRCNNVNLRSVLATPALFAEAAFINGQEVPIPAGAIGHSVKYTCTQETLGAVPNIDKAQVTGAINDAKQAFAVWSATTPVKRAKILSRWAELMTTHEADCAAILSAESGKPYAEAMGEHNYSKGYVEWFAGEAERIYGDVITLPRPGVRALVRKEPVGVVGVITPWNFPSAMITRAVAGALAAGCTVVLKPSELTPFSAVTLAKLAAEAGVPAGAFSVVTGQSSEIGPVMTGSPIVRKLSFTGSTAVGIKLYEQCAPTVKKMALELGGNAPVIVCADAEIDIAIDGIVASKFRNAGQTCISANRFFVPASIHDDFVARLVKRVEGLRVGNGGPANLAGSDPAVTMGPLITVAAGQKVAASVARAVEQGATVVCGGKHVEGRPQNFYEPTVLTNVTNEMEITNCEIFGPVASIVKYADDDLDGVVAAANNVPAGLAAYVYTSDYRKQWRLSEALEYGMVGVNEGAISAPSAPFGGVKGSGLGRDGSKYAMDQFLETKYVLMGGKI